MSQKLAHTRKASNSPWLWEYARIIIWVLILLGTQPSIAWKGPGSLELFEFSEVVQFPGYSTSRSQLSILTRCRKAQSHWKLFGFPDLEQLPETCQFQRTDTVSRLFVIWSSQKGNGSFDSDRQLSDRELSDFQEEQVPIPGNMSLQSCVWIWTFPRYRLFTKRLGSVYRSDFEKRRGFQELDF